MHKAPVNKILPFSSVDGPGNRSVVFTQGCNMNCMYCHNPETIQPCIACGLCVSKCPAGALQITKDKLLWEEALCTECDRCIQSCPHCANPRIQYMDAEEVMRRLQPNLPFIQGITLSGGEMSLWAPFAAQLFEAAKQKGKTAYADSNGLLDFSLLPELTRHMDKAMLDLKAADPQQHKMLTGQPVDTVFKNIRYLASIGKLYEIRTVVVPELLNNAYTVECGSRMIAPWPDVRYKLIRYRPFGVRPNKLQAGAPADGDMQKLADTARSLGVRDVVII